MRTVLVGTWVVIALAATLPARVEGGTRLRGEVRSGPGRPIPAATVVASREQSSSILGLTATDGAGFVVLDGLPAGSYRIVVSAPGFVTGAVDALELGGPFRSVVDVLLTPGAADPIAVDLAGTAGEPAQVSVQVVGDRNTPMTGVRVRLRPVGHRADPDEVRTDEQGHAVLGPLAPGAWRLSLARTGWIGLVVPRLTWRGGQLEIIARMLPLPAGTVTPEEELLPPPRYLDPEPASDPLQDAGPADQPQDAGLPDPPREDADTGSTDDS